MTFDKFLKEKFLEANKEQYEKWHELLTKDDIEKFVREWENVDTKTAFERLAEGHSDKHVYPCGGRKLFPGDYYVGDLPQGMSPTGTCSGITKGL